MIRSFISIRLLQGFRELKTLGWWRVAVLLVVMLGAAIAFYRQMQLFPGCLYAAGVVAAVVSVIHLSRKDQKFMLLTGSVPLKIYLAEYTFFSLPVLLIMVFSPHWYLAPALVVWYLGLSRVYRVPLRKIRSIRTFPLIPRDNFEWRSGIRTNLWPLLVLYLLCLGFLSYAYVSLFVLWILMAFIIPFYQEFEPLEILGCWELDPRAFLRKKITSHLWFFLLVTAPVMVGYGLFHPGEAWIALVVWLLSLINLAFFILSKYAAYTPGGKMPGGNFPVSLVHLSMLVPVAGPFLFPLPLLMGIRAYRKSLVTLKPYLDVYN